MKDHYGCKSCGHTYGNHSVFCEKEGRLGWLPGFLFFTALISCTFIF